MGEARCDPLQSARCDSLQEEGGVADFSEADRDAMEVMEDFWSMSGENIYRHNVTPREQLYVPKDSSFPIPSKYIDVVRETKSNVGDVMNARFFRGKHSWL